MNSYECRGREAEKAEPIQGGTDVRGEGMLALRVEIRHVSEKVGVWLVRMADSPVLTGLQRGPHPAHPTSRGKSKLHGEIKRETGKGYIFLTASIKSEQAYILLRL